MHLQNSSYLLVETISSLFAFSFFHEKILENPKNIYNFHLQNQFARTQINERD